MHPAQWRWLLAYIAIFLAFAGARAYSDRYHLNPDAISYLDMAHRLADGHADPLTHRYWSPLYPAVLAVAIKAGGVTPDSEFPILHLVNWLIFVVMAFAFAFLLKRLGSAGRWWFPVWAGFCFALLWHYGSQFLPLSTGNPDAIVATVAFLAAALALSGGMRSALLLGLVLGIGYYAKAAMLPIGVLLLLCLAGQDWKRRRGLSRVAIAAGVFAVVVSPLILGLSFNQHRFTFGDSGKLNYAWSVNGLPAESGWVGSDPSQGRPVHAPRVIADHPLTLEFASPVPGTQPLWYDPAYWYEGANTRFNVRGELRVLRSDAAFFSDLITNSIIPAAVILTLALVEIRRRRRAPIDAPFLLIWPVLVVGMYAAVALETRYVAPFLILLALGCIQMLSTSRARSAQRAALLVGALLIALPAAKDTLKAASGVRRAPAQSDASGTLEAAHRLADFGIARGESIGAIDTGFYFYFAHIAGVRITAAVYEPVEFWKLDESGQLRVLEAMAGTGVRAVVAAKRDSLCGASGLWRPLGNSDYMVWMPAR